MFWFQLCVTIVLVAGTIFVGWQVWQIRQIRKGP